jgi:hypothetical protein
MVWITGNGESPEILQRFFATPVAHLSGPHNPAQNLCHLDIYEVWGMKRHFRGEDPFLNRRVRGCSQEHLKDRRCVNNDHR